MGETVDYEGSLDHARLGQLPYSLAMTYYVGFDDSNLHEWLEDHIWPAESLLAEVTTKAVQFALAGCYQGQPTFNDMYNPHGIIA